MLNMSEAFFQWEGDVLLFLFTPISPKDVWDWVAATFNVRLLVVNLVMLNMLAVQL